MTPFDQKGNPSSKQREKTQSGKVATGSHHRGLEEKGHSISAIARQMEMDPKTVRKYLQLESLKSTRAPRTKVWDAFRQWIWKRWSEGPQNTGVLFQELGGMGYQGSFRTLQRFVAKWRTEGPKKETRPKMPNPRRIKYLFTKQLNELDPEDRSNPSFLGLGVGAMRRKSRAIANRIGPAVSPTTVPGSGLNPSLQGGRVGRIPAGRLPTE